MFGIKAILLDFDGVMVNRFTELSVKDFCSAFGALGVKPDDFKKVSSVAATGLDVGSKSEIEYFNELIHGLKLNMTADKLRNFFIEADRRNIRLDERFCAWLEKKGSTGIVIGLATNVSKELAGRLDNGGFYKMFSKRFFSYKIGAPKQDERFWRHVMDDLKFEPHEIIFIDDNKNNIEAAAAAGLQCFLYKGFDQMIGEMI
jgi:FMN phosphatase YigB (HAD superfamily)